MVEDARRARVDSEEGIFEEGLGTEALICANEIRAENPANKRNATTLRADSRELRVALLHLVLPQIIIVEVFQILAQLFAVNGGDRIGGRLLGGFQNLVLHKDRAIHAQRQR